jgi:sodium transport system permease protein
MFFSREDILLNENLKFYDIFTLNRQAFPQPTPGTSTVLFLILFCCFFYFSSALQSLLGGNTIEDLKSPITLISTVIVQFSVIMGIPLLMSWYFKMNTARVFSFRLPQKSIWVAAILLGLSMPLIGLLSSQLISPPEEFAKKMETAIFGDGNRSIWLLLCAIAIVPAICEEIAFRGIILKGFLSRLSPWWSIILSSFLFALLHLSIYRFMPTFCLGLLLGYAVWKSGSLYVSIIMHALNNGMGVVLFYYQKQFEAQGVMENQALMGSISLSMVTFLIIGFTLLTKSKTKEATL